MNQDKPYLPYMKGELQDVLAKMLEGPPGPCILCKASGQYVGIFDPFEHWRQKVVHLHPAGYRGDVFLYWVCQACLDRPSSTEEIEARIESNVHKGAIDRASRN